MSVRFPPEVIEQVRAVCLQGSDDDVGRMLVGATVVAAITTILHDVTDDTARHVLACLRASHPQWFEASEASS